MKTALIVVLFVALLAAAFISRPAPADFKRFITDQTTGADTNALKVGWDQYKADQYVQHCAFSDRLLWVDVRQDGKTIYTGALGHWFSHAQAANAVKAAEQKMESIHIDKQ